jgi:hypothetical protein
MLAIAQKLDRLSALIAEQEALDAQKQALIDQVIPPDVKARLADVEAEFAQKAEAAASNIQALEAEIKAETLGVGETVRASGIQAVWNKGRQTWDSKGLSSYSESHPDILQFRKEGEPTVTIRRSAAKDSD